MRVTVGAFVTIKNEDGRHVNGNFAIDHKVFLKIQN